MNGAAELLGAIDRGLSLLEEEWRIFMTGAYHLLGAVIERKRRLLSVLEEAIHGAPRTSEIVAALDRLIAQSRRNEGLIAAARQGIRQARRRIDAIRTASRGAVAYAEDGSRIACAADGIDTEKSA